MLNRPEKVRLRVAAFLKEKGWTTKILAEKTGMSESYLTHIKNATRRWNEDSLTRIAHAFDIDPLDLLEASSTLKKGNQREHYIPAQKEQLTSQAVMLAPIVKEIPEGPLTSASGKSHHLQNIQGYFPFSGTQDSELFVYLVPDDRYEPVFNNKTHVIISPSHEIKSGDYVAASYKTNKSEKGLFKITFADSFTILESLISETAPIALVREKDEFTIIGRLVGTYIPL